MAALVDEEVALVFTSLLSCCQCCSSLPAHLLSPPFPVVLSPLPPLRHTDSRLGASIEAAMEALWPTVHHTDGGCDLFVQWTVVVQVVARGRVLVEGGGGEETTAAVGLDGGVQEGGDVGHSALV